MLVISVNGLDKKLFILYPVTARVNSLHWTICHDVNKNAYCITNQNRNILPGKIKCLVTLNDEIHMTTSREFKKQKLFFQKWYIHTINSSFYIAQFRIIAKKYQINSTTCFILELISYFENFETFIFCVWDDKIMPITSTDHDSMEGDETHVKCFGTVAVLL